MITVGALCLMGALLCAGGYAVSGKGWLLSLSITLGTTAYHFIMRLLVGLAFNSTMKNQADCTKAWYQPLRWEKGLYKALRVKRWKEVMPTFSPELFSTRQHSLSELAQAMCQAELVHEVCAVLSFLPVVSAHWFGALPVFLLTSLGGALLDLMFVMIQRYNRPKVLRLMQRQGAFKADEKRKEENDDSIKNT